MRVCNGAQFFSNGWFSSFFVVETLRCLSGYAAQRTILLVKINRERRIKFGRTSLQFSRQSSSNIPRKTLRGVTNESSGPGRLTEIGSPENKASRGNTLFYNCDLVFFFFFFIFSRRTRKISRTSFAAGTIALFLVQPVFNDPEITGRNQSTLRVKIEPIQSLELFSSTFKEENYTLEMIAPLCTRALRIFTICCTGLFSATTSSVNILFEIIIGSRSRNNFEERSEHRFRI